MLSAQVVLLVGALLGQCRLGVVGSNAGVWSAWTTCTSSCNGGMSMRDRSCSNPPPGSNGADCVGAIQEFKKCNAHPCPSAAIDGGWSDWQPWYGCTTSCGSGVKLRERECDHPPPGPGGRFCMGKSHESSVCNTQACPPAEVDGGWADWNPWYPCTASCGGGIVMRERECTNPPPGPTGRHCRGKGHQTSACNTQPCPTPNTGAPFVAFSVLLSKDFRRQFPSKIPFDTPAYEGKDNYYNFTDHAFHAPVDGKYFFSFDASSNNMKNAVISMYMEIKKPGENIPICGRALRLGPSNNHVQNWGIYAEAHGAEQNNAAASVIREMKKGDTAELCSSGRVEQGMVHFSGMLIHMTY